MTNRPDYPQSQETINPGAADATVRSATMDGSHEESQHTNYVDPAGNRFSNRIAVYQDTNRERANRRSWVTTIISFLLGVLEMILVLRFVFRLLGANQDNSFILSLYHLSQVFIAPFNGIFNDQTLGASSVFELSTLTAMLVFALLAWGLVALSRVIFAPNDSGRQQVTTTQRSER